MSLAVIRFIIAILYSNAKLTILFQTTKSCLVLSPSAQTGIWFISLPRDATAKRGICYERFVHLFVTLVTSLEMMKHVIQCPATSEGIVFSGCPSGCLSVRCLLTLSVTWSLHLVDAFQWNLSPVCIRVGRIEKIFKVKG